MNALYRILTATLLTFILTLSASMITFAQEEGQEQTPVSDDGKKPVRAPFEAILLIDNQTYQTQAKGSHEIHIHHRFGKFGNGFTDLMGIYAPSNIRLGYTYGITPKITVGFGTEKNNKMQEIEWKYNILHQTRDNSIPLAVTYYGNFVIDGRNKDNFGETYKFIHRLSYFNELLIGRKFNNRLTLQVGANFTHFNSVDSLMEHDKIGVTFGGRFKIWNDNSFIFEYDKPLHIKGIQEHLELTNPPAPNYAFGIEFSTSTHAFQVFATSWDHIILQKNYQFAQNKFFKKDILLGFNITVRL